jgi:putative tryptophan/tyrosine transport system substrate-binding protein
VRRRSFITLLGGVVSWPLAARAQQRAMPVIGLVGGASPGAAGLFTAALREGLRETGYVEGQNSAIEYRWAEGHYDRLPALAADLVGRKVDVIVTQGGPPSALRRKALPRLSRSFFTPVPIRSRTASSPVSPGRAATSPASTC